MTAQLLASLAPALVAAIAVMVNAWTTRTSLRAQRDVTRESLASQREMSRQQEEIAQRRALSDRLWDRRSTLYGELLRWANNIERVLLDPDEWHYGFLSLHHYHMETDVEDRLGVFGSEGVQMAVQAVRGSLLALVEDSGHAASQDVTWDEDEHGHVTQLHITAREIDDNESLDEAKWAVHSSLRSLR